MLFLSHIDGGIPQQSTLFWSHLVLCVQLSAHELQKIQKSAEAGNWSSTETKDYRLQLEQLFSTFPESHTPGGQLKQLVPQRTPHLNCAGIVTLPFFSDRICFGPPPRALCQTDTLRKPKRSLRILTSPTGKNRLVELSSGMKA